MKCPKCNEVFSSYKKENVPTAYYSWRSLKKRCDNKNDPRYSRYGGRGITYDPKWKTYKGFWEDMGPVWQAGLSLDRIDNNGHYSKENCRWATEIEQQNNRGNNRKWVINGVRKSLVEWCVVYGIPYTRVINRVYSGKWTLEKALTTPPIEKGKSR